MTVAEIIQICVAPLCVAAMTYVVPKLVSRDKYPQFDEIKKKIDAVHIFAVGINKTVTEHHEEVTTKVNQLLANDDRQDAILKEYALELLKMQAWNTNLHVEDRMYSAVKYFKQGGNGDTRKMIMNLAAEDPQNMVAFDMACKMLRYTPEQMMT